MLAVTEPGVKKITVMGPTQLLKTELINNIVGYFIHQDPAPIIVMQPTGKLAEAWSKDRLDKMLRDTPALAGRVKDKRVKDSDNTILHKSFPGGHVTIVSAGSPSDLAMRPVRLVLCDEVDKYETTVEGDPIKLVEERSATFWNALSVRVCSPTIQGRSRIEAEYELSDKREFHGLCPHCGEYEWLKWDQVNFERECYVCSHCRKDWSEPDRLKAISNGKYIATAPFNGHAGFHVNKIASPWQSIAVLIQKFKECGKDPEKLRTFKNTQLAETWAESGEKPDHMRLYERRETYPQNTIPKGVVFLTVGADVQKDRIEYEVVGWTKDKRSYSIDYQTIMGQTHTSEPWLELDKLLNRTWLAEDREIRVSMLAVDSGFNTQYVYDWVRKHSPNRVRAIKGQDSLDRIFGTPKDIDISRSGSKLKRASKVWPVGSSVIKSELYGWLKLDGAGDDGVYPIGYCHFPQYDEEHFKRLCSEQQMKKKLPNGFYVYSWEKTYERNEQLDCRVYARAAAAMFGIDRFSARDWEILEGKNLYREEEKQPEVETTPVAPPVQKPVLPKHSMNSSSFWARQNHKKKLW